MATTTGIGLSSELVDAFSDAVDSGSVRFIKVSISNESLVPDSLIPPSGTFEEDLGQIGNILEDNVPAYVLARFDTTGWLAIFYVPDTAKVRDKMLYAATRTSVTKSLGSAHFTDSIFATTKDDITPEAYTKHKAHLAAPKPLSAREKELADLAEAEKQSGVVYQGRAAKVDLHRSPVGLKWSEEVKDALKELATDGTSRLLVVSVDPSETLVLTSANESDAGSLGKNLPSAEPSYGFFAWTHNSERQIVFIYSCPSASSIKPRMIYASASLATLTSAKALLEEAGGSPLASRKVETSDPNELNDEYLQMELNERTSHTAAPAPVQNTPFARPKGPGRKR